MNHHDKQQALSNFNNGTTPILVSTTVVEVGVDCKNATVIMIEHAERFGLAQLHQLRGRVGRNQQQSYCFLISDSNSKNRQRLRLMESISDGFMLAEMDLQLRGSGELLGTLQHGIPQFKIADLTEKQDQYLLELATKATQTLIEDDPTLNHSPLLHHELQRRFYCYNNYQQIALN